MLAEIVAAAAIAAQGAEAVPPVATVPPASTAAAATVAAPTAAPAPVVRLLTLGEAEQMGLVNQPQIMQARAQSDAAYARVDESRSGFFPQVNGTAGYTRATSHRSVSTTVVPTTVSPATTNSSFKTFNSFNFGLNASQLVYDFGQTYGAYRASKANAEATQQNQETIRQDVLFSVRSNFVQAWANRALVDVAKENLANQDRHLAQVQGMVTAGSRPEIDLAQVRADRANAELSLINAENGYETSKAQLILAMGVDEGTDFDVADDPIGEVNGEDLDDDRLARTADLTRPELKVIAKQLEANERQISAIKGQYGPSIGVSTGLTEGGPDLSTMAWNWSAGANLTWPIFQGGITNARVHEAEANRSATQSQVSLTRQQIRFDVTQARLAIRAGKASLVAAGEVEVNAKERLRLAEARYKAGAGSIIELQDAQVDATTASGQVVQANFSLSLARAQMLKALGRP